MPGPPTAAPAARPHCKRTPLTMHPPLPSPPRLEATLPPSVSSRGAAAPTGRLSAPPASAGRASDSVAAAAASMYDGKRAAVQKEAQALRREGGGRGPPSPPPSVGDWERLGGYGGSGSRTAAWTSGAIAAYTELCALGPLLPVLDGRAGSARSGMRASIRHVPTPWGVASGRRTQPSEAALLSFISRVSEPGAWEAEEAVRARKFLRYSGYMRRKDERGEARGGI